MPLPVINPTFDVPVILVNTPGAKGTFDFDFSSTPPTLITGSWNWSSQLPAVAPPAGPAPFTTLPPGVANPNVPAFTTTLPTTVAPGVPPFTTGGPSSVDPGVPPFDQTAPVKLPMGGETPGRGDRILITKLNQPIAVV